VHRMKHPKHGDDEDMRPTCLSKLICIKSLGEKVVGFHFIGPNAGEVTQVCMCFETNSLLYVSREAEESNTVSHLEFSTIRDYSCISSEVLRTLPSYSFRDLPWPLN
jgi:hypothetical protein